MPTIQDFLNEGIPLKLDECNEELQQFSFSDVTPEQQARIISMLSGNIPIIFSKAVHAPDFIISTPQVKDDPLEAMQEAIVESKKDGQRKSIGLMVLSQIKYTEQLINKIEKLELEVNALKKRVK